MFVLSRNHGFQLFQKAQRQQFSRKNWWWSSSFHEIAEKRLVVFQAIVWIFPIFFSEPWTCIRTRSLNFHISSYEPQEPTVNSDEFVASYCFWEQPNTSHKLKPYYESWSQGVKPAHLSQMAEMSSHEYQLYSAHEVLMQIGM